MEELTRDAVFAGWGVWPEQIGDYLALIGDSADNIPGVKGIGPKSAVKLLADFGSLDGIYQNLDAISAKGQRTKLADDEAAARLSRRLVALRDDVELPAGPDGYPVGALNLAAAAGILLEQGMHRLLQDAGVPLQTAKAALAQRGGGVFSERTTEDAQPGVPKPGAPPAMLVAHLFRSRNAPSSRRRDRTNWSIRLNIWMFGSSASAAPRCSRSIPKPPRSTRWWPSRSDFRSRPRSAPGVTCRWWAPTDR